MSYIPVVCFRFIGGGARRVRRRLLLSYAKRIRHAVVGAHPPEGCAAAGELSEKLQSPLDEVLVELEHAAVPGVGIEDELAVRESPVEVDGVLGGHHLVALAVHDEYRRIASRQVRTLLLRPSAPRLRRGTGGAHGAACVAG